VAGGVKNRPLVNLGPSGGKLWGVGLGGRGKYFVRSALTIADLVGFMHFKQIFPRIPLFDGFEWCKFGVLCLIESLLVRPWPGLIGIWIGIRIWQ